MRLDRIALVAIVALLIALAGPCAVQSQTNAQAGLRASDIGWAAVFTAKDVTRSVAYVADDGSVLAPNAPKATGHSAVRKLFEGFFSLPNMHITWHPTLVGIAQAGDIGYTSGQYQLSFTQKGKTIADQGKYVTLWKRTAGGIWKVYLDIFNSDLPQPG